MGRQSGLNNRFDVVIGNPPFESKFTEAAKRVNATHVAERGKMPDKQIAYLFLDQCLRMLSPNGRLCLIQPFGFLYNLQSHWFRSFVAKTGRLESVLDFTSVRGLYRGGGSQDRRRSGRQCNQPLVLALDFPADVQDGRADRLRARPLRPSSTVGGRGRLPTRRRRGPICSAEAVWPPSAARLRRMRTLAQFVDEARLADGRGVHRRK